MRESNSTLPPNAVAEAYASVEELNEAILELQRDLCRYAGMPMPSEREAFAKARNAVLEEAAEVALNTYFADVGWPESYRNAAVKIARNIRALKQEGAEGLPEATKERSTTDLIRKLCNSAKDSPGCIYPECDCGT